MGRKQPKRTVLGENPFVTPSVTASDSTTTAAKTNEGETKQPSSSRTTTRRRSKKKQDATSKTTSKEAARTGVRSPRKSATSNKRAKTKRSSKKEPSTDPLSRTARKTTPQTPAKRSSTKSSTKNRRTTSAMSLKTPSPTSHRTDGATASTVSTVIPNTESSPTRSRTAPSGATSLKTPTDERAWMGDQDPFGLDPHFEKGMRPWLRAVYERYFRISTHGLDNVPAGRALLVANHAGAFPYDGLMLSTALKDHHPAHPTLRWLLEDHVYYTPFAGNFLNRLGGVRACQANGAKLLSRGELVGVFPEGAKGSGRLFKQRHRLQRFGRGGFVRLGLRTKSPVVPCAIVGPEEATPLLARVQLPIPLLGWPYLPITPTFPWLGPLGLIPAPTRWTIVFGEPVPMDVYGDDAENDDVLVRRLNERIRATIQSMVDSVVEGRSSVWTAP